MEVGSETNIKFLTLVTLTNLQVTTHKGQNFETTFYA
ncbi:unnamed protein product [Arabidopsis halleri]